MSLRKNLERLGRDVKCIKCNSAEEPPLPPEPIDYTPFFEELIELAKTDESYQLFEDTDGNVLFGKLDEDGVMTYYKPDGSVYTGDVKPYSRELKQTITDYCADSIPYSLIQLRDADTKEVVASIWRNDNDLTESNTAPANVTKGVCVVTDLTGTNCDTPIFANLCNVTDITEPINAKLDEVITALNDNSQAEQLILTSIDTKLDELALIKDELVLANTTLTDIKTDTAQINTNLETVIEKLDDQITALEELKVLVTETNTQLTTANATLTTISTDIATIKDDIALIKTDISEIKTSVASIDNKLDTVITSLTSIETKLDSVVTELQTINTTLQTEFDQTQEKLDEIKEAIEFAQGTFQVEDCDGTPIGEPQNV
jgi:predicted  nucleic acid-binding Zn-ribbon protein